MNDHVPADNLFYDTHVFFCTNERPAGHPRGCCKAKGSETLRNYMKAKAKELGLDRTRINSAGCLDRCELGPTLVIYPEGIWYRCATTEDVDRVLVEHVKNGNPIKDLMLGPDE
ncbi:MAG: (2Fe-2S) ferredoxin domain-containing protein [Rhodospirillales bacterium]|nr:(2Fe-2S) ferredoxin domain-containing protein [Rhodospirillales bacterium]